MQSKYLKARIKDTVHYEPHEIKLIKIKYPQITHTQQVLFEPHHKR